MANVSIDNLADEINRLMKEYTAEVEKGMKQAQEKVAKMGVEVLKSTSPKRFGKYAQAWKSREEKGGYVIYNTRGQLTHLLEKGHATRNGGRSRAFVHIAPVEQSVIEQYEKEVVKVIQNG